MKVISRKQLPCPMPVLFTAVSWLLMDRFQAGGVVQGVVWTLLAVLWLGWATRFFKEDWVEVKL